jgi:peptide/nickel transport system substrate-binding protein
MRKRLSLLILGLLAVLSVAPVGAAAQSTVTIAINGEPETMDPHVYSSFIGAMVWPWASDKLVIADTKTGDIIPWLAERYERLDSKRVKFTLRTARFTDGTPVTAEAVKYSFERIVDPANKSYQRAYWKDFDRIEVLDDRTVVFHMKAPDNGLIRRLTIWGHVISLGNKGKPPEEISRHLVSGGPYVLKGWTKGQRYEFEANPTWWGNSLFPQRPQRVIMRPIVEATTRVKALQAGEIDIAHKVLPHFIPDIKKDPKLDVVSRSSVRIAYIGFFTTQGGPFADVRVRRAANHAIDADAMYKTFLAGYAEPAHQIFHPWTQFGYSPDKRWYGFDPAKGRQLMKEAEYEKGFKADLISPDGNSPFDRQSCEAAAGMLQKIGIDTRCIPQPFALYRQTFNTYLEGKNKTPAMHFLSFGNAAGDNSTILRGTTSCGGAWSPACYKDLDEMIDRALALENPKEQHVAFQKISDKMLELATHKPLYRLHDIFGVNRRIEFTARHDEQLHPWEIVVK